MREEGKGKGFSKGKRGNFVPLQKNLRKWECNNNLGGATVIPFPISPKIRNPTWTQIWGANGPKLKPKSRLSFV